MELANADHLRKSGNSCKDSGSAVSVICNCRKGHLIESRTKCRKRPRSKTRFKGPKIEDEYQSIGGNSMNYR